MQPKKKRRKEKIYNPHNNIFQSAEAKRKATPTQTTPTTPTYVQQLK